MKKISLNKIVKINNRVSLISSAIAAVIGAGYAYTTLNVPEEEMNILIILAIPLLFILLAIVYILSNNINTLYMQKYYKQQRSDIDKLDKIFSEKNISSLNDIQDLEDDINKIITLYQR